jgi:acyl-homoserine lactone acylase PvdQ
MLGNAFLNLTARNGLADYIAMQPGADKARLNWVRADKAENVPLLLPGKGTKGHTGYCYDSFRP